MSPVKWFVTLAVLIIGSKVNAAIPRHMDEFIRVLEHVEAQNPGLGPLGTVRALRHLAGYGDLFAESFLGSANDDYSRAALVLNVEFDDFIGKALRHRVSEGGEEVGVVLIRDGTTVAMAPLLLGIEAGLQTKVDALHAVALTRTLGLSFLAFHNSLLPQRLGPSGCWDSVTWPAMFTLPGKPSLATEALINGGMDGIILGTEISLLTQRPPTLSGLLKQYYSYSLGPGGLDSAPRLISVLRRDNFRELVSAASLRKEVMSSMQVHWRLMGDVRAVGSKRIVKEGVQEFIQSYANCPTIIPRCQWGAEPYRGTPTQLSPPLSYMYVHHTYEPGQPCLSFDQCAADMRSMQRFHQDGNGWDDIGYSFVAGSDGNIYEGRGWAWQGAHTLGHNSKGYGVAIIGDFTSCLPSPRTLELVRERLPACAVGSGHLSPGYIVHGHRQLVNTSCPGDTLYREIQTWPHFREV
uniref:Peptidoglycan recognition protein 6 n=1 Tax=Paramormyrops kingsleyae TaxID=1676925 RepID=A0A3B3RX18_9TELE|nr:N-acetylmuramoyl-L-alanine amidase-like [Paramormyrops kingsleyae]